MAHPRDPAEWAKIAERLLELLAMDVVRSGAEIGNDGLPGDGLPIRQPRTREDKMLLVTTLIEMALQTGKVYGLETAAQIIEQQALLDRDTTPTALAEACRFHSNLSGPYVQWPPTRIPT